MRLTASHAAGSSPLPHTGTSAAALVLFMRYTLAGDGWSASTMRAGWLSSMSALGTPTSTTVPILSPAPATPSAASAFTAAVRRSSEAWATPIAPMYGMPVPLLVAFVPGSNVTLALPVATVRLRLRSMPVLSRISAESVPLTSV